MHKGCIKLNKKCKGCLIVKKLSDFHKRGNGVRALCKDCRNHKKREVNKDPDKRYARYIYDANRRNLEFSLSYEEFLMFADDPCFYCGEELDGISLDRINNNLGYLIGNVVSCCSTCNSIKYVYEKDEFLKHVEKIFMYQQKVKYGKQENTS